MAATTEEPVPAGDSAAVGFCDLQIDAAVFQADVFFQRQIEFFEGRLRVARLLGGRARPLPARWISLSVAMLRSLSSALPPDGSMPITVPDEPMLDWPKRHFA